MEREREKSMEREWMESGWRVDGERDEMERACGVV
jgi:hypothetical protein